MLFHLAICEHQCDRNVDALEILNRSIALEPNHSGFHAYRAFVLIALHRKKEAVTAAQEAIRLDPVSAEAHASLATPPALRRGT